MKISGLSSFQRALVTLLLGVSWIVWLNIVVFIFVVRGYIDLSAAEFLPVVLVPLVLSLCAVSVLSGSTWYGSTIGDKQQSRDRFLRHFGFWILGASVTALTIEVLLLLTVEPFSTLHTISAAGFLVFALIALWAPKIGVLRAKPE